VTFPSLYNLISTLCLVFGAPIPSQHAPPGAAFPVHPPRSQHTLYPHLDAHPIRKLLRAHTQRIVDAVAVAGGHGGQKAVGHTCKPARDETGACAKTIARVEAALEMEGLGHRQASEVAGCRVS